VRSLIVARLRPSVVVRAEDPPERAARLEVRADEASPPASSTLRMLRAAVVVDDLDVGAVGVALVRVVVACAVSRLLAGSVVGAVGRTVGHELQAREGAQRCRRSASLRQRPRRASRRGRCIRADDRGRDGPPRRCSRRGRAGTRRSSSRCTAAAGPLGRRRGS
jgi:hypothetical protein